jgi:hypothetical protein
MDSTRTENPRDRLLDAASSNYTGDNDEFDRQGRRLYASFPRLHTSVRTSASRGVGERTRLSIRSMAASKQEVRLEVRRAIRPGTLQHDQCAIGQNPHRADQAFAKVMALLVSA